MQSLKFKYLPTDLPPVLDWEVGQDNGNGDADKALTWLILVEKELKKTPIIYTGPSFFSSILCDNKGTFKQFPLWIANYSSEPLIPAPWNNWLFWQYSETGKVSGINGECDLNYFNGTLADLTAFASKEVSFL